MIDLGISKLALIGVVALVVIGPEKLPKVARTVGALLGKAQRYVADVKAEVSRSIELEELKKDLDEKDKSNDDPIARKMDDRISTRHYVDAMKYMVTREAWEARLGQLRQRLSKLAHYRDYRQYDALIKYYAGTNPIALTYGTVVVKEPTADSYNLVRYQ